MGTSVLVANHQELEAQTIVTALGKRYPVQTVEVQKVGEAVNDDTVALVLDANCSEDHAIDILMEVLAKVQVPVLMIVPPEDPRCAVEALRCGASSYLVKNGNYVELIGTALDEMLVRADRESTLKGTIVALRQKVSELEKQLDVGKGKTAAASRPPESTAEKRARMLTDIARRLASGDAGLPSYPQIATRIREATEKADASIPEIASLISQDMAIGGKLLALANSPIYRAGNPASTVEQAIGRLGISTTKSMVDMVANRSLYLHSNHAWLPLFEQLWQESLASAWASRLTAKKVGVANPEAVFGVGLFHNAGKLLLLQGMADVFPEAKPLETLEGVQEVQDFIAKNQPRFGAALLKRWRFEKNYQDAALYSTEPDKAPAFTKELLVIHLADRIAAANDSNCCCQDLENSSATRFLGLDPTALEEIHSETMKAVTACNASMSGAKAK